MKTSIKYNIKLKIGVMKRHIKELRQRIKEDEELLKQNLTNY